MKTITKKQFVAYGEYRNLGVRIAELQRQQKAAKAQLMKAFGRAKRIGIQNGPTLEKVRIDVEPTEVPAPYHYYKIREV